MEKNIPQWEFKAHSYQIADTGDYDGHYELTNGEITLWTKDDDEDTERFLRLAAHFLNKIGINLSEAKVDDLSYQVHLLELEKKELQGRVKELEDSRSGAVWVKATTRLPHNWHLKCVRFIHTKAPLVAPETWLSENEKAIEVVEWLDESTTPAAGREEDGVAFDKWCKEQNKYNFILTAWYCKVTGEHFTWGQLFEIWKSQQSIKLLATEEVRDPQELWDAHSEYIDDNSDDLCRWAGSVVITKEAFFKALAEWSGEKEVTP